MPKIQCPKILSEGYTKSGINPKVEIKGSTYFSGKDKKSDKMSDT